MEILNDFNTTVEKALDEIDGSWRSYEGLIICGTHRDNNLEKYFEYKIKENSFLDKIKYVREEGIPFLGICRGHQLAAQEYADNVLKQNSDMVIVKLPKLKVGLHNGETYWNNYEVVEGFEDLWEKSENFITCQYHPEYQSSKNNHHPLLVSFLKKCKKEYNEKN